MKMIDLRSDTVTLPTPRMRKAMAAAELGDDVFNEDPTTNRLQELSAEKLGMEAGLLVPSGTMGNLVCALTHCRRGEEIILGAAAHIFLNEAGGSSAVGGIHPRTVPNLPDGTIPLGGIEAAIRGDNEHYPRTRLICLENTQNSCNGAALTPEYTRSVADLAKKHGLRVHLDGSRIFNAAVALGVDARHLTEGVDSVTFCLSKGLSAPVGSVVCGSADFVAEARRNRKVLGGGMRECGVIAAAGVVALEDMIDRLAEDHENAHRLAEGIAEVRALSIEPENVRTNILYFDLIGPKMTPEGFLREMDSRGIRFLRTGPARFRMVTHYGVDAKDIDTVLRGIREALS